jgi:hypothetical protein
VTRRPRCAISIDLDAVACYYKIHGLGAAPAELEHVVLERALPRAAALFASRGIHVTWFVVGRDADADAALPDRAQRSANAARLRELSHYGDELGNHSYSHPYELARLAPDVIDDEVANCDRVLRAITRIGTRGFRAPGYDVSPPMLDALARRAYRYDSSIFPAPGYYAAKAAVMAALAIARRPSGAVMIDPRSQTAPADPYRPSMTAPWRRGQAPLVELPIAVTPWVRIPAIGTSLLVAPAIVRSRVIAAMAKRDFSTSSCTASTSPTRRRMASRASSSRGRSICAFRSRRSSRGWRRSSTSSSAGGTSSRSPRSRRTSSSPPEGARDQHRR